MSKSKQFFTKSGKRRPVTLKKGFDEYEFRVGDHIIPDRISVGQKDMKKWNMQKMIAIDLTPRANEIEFEKQMLNRSRH